MFVWPIIALVGILSAVWFFGARKPGAIGSADAIRQRVRDAYPDLEIGEIALDPNGTAALVAAPTGFPVILMFVLGNQVVSRELSPGIVRNVAITGAGDGRRRVAIQLYDLGCPRAAFTLEAHDAEQWAERLEHLVAPPLSVR